MHENISMRTMSANGQDSELQFHEEMSYLHRKLYILEDFKEVSVFFSLYTRYTGMFDKVQLENFMIGHGIVLKITLKLVGTYWFPASVGVLTNKKKSMF